jgi:hypothetical protein
MSPKCSAAKSLIFLIAFIVLTLTGCETTASTKAQWAKPPANWVLVGGGDSQGGYVFYADPATITRTGDVVKMWSMYDYKAAQVSRAARAEYLSLVGQNEYDCKNEKERRLYFRYHSGHVGDGALVFSTAGLVPPDQWDAFSPRSAAASLWKIACGAK